SVHEKFGLEAGINAGDALFAEAFEFLAESPLEPSLVKQLVKDVALMSKGIVEGQQMDVDFESTINSVKIEDYLKMIEKKTALLFQIAAKGGALIAGASQEDVKNMKEFGRLSGIAFQICDDLLDIVGVEKEIGKPKWSDIRKGKKTLMVIHALQHASDEEKKILKKALGKRNASDEEVEASVSVMEKLGSISNARKLAKEYRDKAKKCLEKIPDSEYRRLLFDLTDFMVERIK
ncbi:MAG TPA: polyprenyl synthetase family protein, partial [Thermoplasmata archaeon]|nr:polyprenyl synthetase family protein [Thermoplasmata archaeon]